MRKRWLLALVGVALVATAGTIAGALANAHDDIKQGTPDLIVDQKILQNHWIVRDETFAADDCSAAEGGFPAGDPAWRGQPESGVRSA